MKRILALVQSEAFAVCLFVAAIILCSAPFMITANIMEHLWFMNWYLFAVWGLLIAGIFLMTGGSREGDGSQE